MGAACIAAIDQGTTSTRCILFDGEGRVLGLGQREHAQHFPRPGWVEHDPREIRDNTALVIRDALRAAGGDVTVAAVGVTNQRETLVVWDRRSGEPLANAIVWQDTRTRAICDRLAGEAGPARFQARTGLPLATYFSGPKLTWLLENQDGVRAALERGDAVCGTMESWTIWNLTGGPDGGALVTDVTNASRTMWLDLATLDWDEELLEVFGAPRAALPRIVPCSDREPWGFTRRDGPFGAAIPVCGAAGDQQAAMIGQGCFEVGEAKNTYGTGCFLLMNTGEAPVASRHGLLTTVAYRLGDAPARYALEGSVAIAGALVQWLRDNLGVIGSSAEVEALARSVEDSGGVVIVPAFSGLFAPHWRPDARGVVAGLTRFATKAHLARAALEAVALQVHDVLEAMRADSGLELAELRVDGGMTRNDLLMQLQADLDGAPVVRPAVVETTALGAAFAAGLAVDLWGGTEDLRRRWRRDRTFEPAMAPERRAALLEGWRKALERSLGWEG
jgi:glycerol kinase